MTFAEISFRVVTNFVHLPSVGRFSIGQRWADGLQSFQDFKFVIRVRLRSSVVKSGLTTPA
jgi:hypothetical protein